MIEKNFVKAGTELFEDTSLSRGAAAAGRKVERKNALAQTHSASLIDTLFDRFGRGSPDKSTVLAHEILVALIVISQMVYDKKIQLIFEIYDEKKRGYLQTNDIQAMLRCTEKLFAIENSTFKFDNDVLYQNNAMLRADQNFKFVSAMIDHHYSQQNKAKQSEEEALLGIVHSVGKNNKVTCSQYLAALKALPAIYRSILPKQGLSLKTIL
jgi:Ca2+-binding EF-hand superfamily protein